MSSHQLIRLITRFFQLHQESKLYKEKVRQTSSRNYHFPLEPFGLTAVLVEDNHIIFKGTKVLVLKSMQTLMLQRTHSSQEACVRRARDVIYWPGMANEIRRLASQCSTCNDYTAKQQKEPLLHQKCQLDHGPL